MNEEIKIKVSLDTQNAEEAINRLDEKNKCTVKDIETPHKISFYPDEEKIKESDDFLKGIFKNYSRLALLASPAVPNILKYVSGNGVFNFNSSKVPGNVDYDDYVTGQKKITEADKKYSGQRMNIYRNENLYKLNSYGNMVKQTGILLGERSNLFKSISLAEAIISTYNAANAALLPPPIGVGPILGEIHAGIVIMNGLKRAEKIAAEKIPGFASGGIVVGEKGPEIIENMQDYAAGRGELIRQTISAVREGLPGSAAFPSDFSKEIKMLREDINKIAERPARAFLDDREARKIYFRGNYLARKTR